MPKTLTVSLTLAVLVLYSTPAEAVPIQVSSAATILNVSAETCFECWGDPNLPDVQIDAQFTVVPETGLYYHPFYQTYLYGTFLKVVAITGLFNGLYAMSLAPSPNGAGPWLYSDYTPGFVNFSAAGVDSRIIFDNAYILLQTPTGGGYGTNTPLRWNAVPVPDGTSSFVLMAVGLIGIAVQRHTSRR